MRLVDGSQMPTSDSVGDAERKSVLLAGMLRWRYPCEDVGKSTKVLPGEAGWPVWLPCHSAT